MQFVLPVLLILLIILKVLGVITASWWLVLLPLWIWLAVIVAVFLIAAIAALMKA
jgi:hypothetical protein